jgi:hypothetical protein
VLEGSIKTLHAHRLRGVHTKGYRHNFIGVFLQKMEPSIESPHALPTHWAFQHSVATPLILPRAQLEAVEREAGAGKGSKGDGALLCGATAKATALPIIAALSGQLPQVVVGMEERRGVKPTLPAGTVFVTEAAHD